MRLHLQVRPPKEDDQFVAKEKTRPHTSSLLMTCHQHCRPSSPIRFQLRLLIPSILLLCCCYCCCIIRCCEAWSQRTAGTGFAPSIRRRHRHLPNPLTLIPDDWSSLERHRNTQQNVVGHKTYNRISKRLLFSVTSNDETTTTTTDSSISTAVDDGSTQPSSGPSVRRQYETFLWTPARHHQQQASTTTTPYRINYRVEGPVGARPILLVHGFGANINHYRYQFPALAQAGYRVYGVDLLGFGASDKPTNTNDVEYNFELFRELLLDFINYIEQQQEPLIEEEEEEEEKTSSSLNRKEEEERSDSSAKESLYRRHDWVVAGNSIGGLLSLAVAERLPDRVGGVVLFNCSGGLSAFRYSDFSNNLLILVVLWLVQQLLKYTPFGANFFRDFKTRDNVESILRQQGVYGDDANVNDELLEILLEPSNDDGAQHVFLQVFAGEPGPTPESILPNIQCPILALWGDADPWTPLDAGMHPGSKYQDYTKAPYHLVRLPGVGHCPHDEVPNMVNYKMIQWMQEELLPTTIESSSSS